MKDSMSYKGFTGSAELDLEAGSIRGKILFITDLVTFEAETAKEIVVEFHAAVDDYLETCKTLGREPLKPCSGTFNVRIGPELHQKLSVYSVCKEESINNLIKIAVSRFLEDPEQKAVVHNHFHTAPEIKLVKSLTYNPQETTKQDRGAYVARYN